MKLKKMLLAALAAAFAAAWFLSAAPAFSQSKDSAQPTPTPVPKAGEKAEPDKIPLATPEEFKSNLDAERQAIAREREALQVLRVQVRQDIEKLQALQAQMDERFAKEDAQLDERIKKMTKIYSTMRPDEVGPLLSRLDEDTVIRIILSMKPKTQADLLARMPPDKAAAISKKIMSKEAK